MLRLKIPPPVVALICGGIMWLVNSLWPGLSVDFPISVYLAVLLVIAGLAIEIWSVRNFIRSRTTISPLSPNKSKHLVTSELYRYTRNPMYVGMLLLLTGFGVWLSNPVSFIALPIFVWYITHFQIKPEEEALQSIFGQPYIDYQNRVKRWFW